MGRRVRKNHEGYYVACGIMYKNGSSGIWGFKLYDLEYECYDFMTTAAIQKLLDKYPMAIKNLKIKEEYLGLMYVTSINYSCYSKKGELIRKGKNIFIRRIQLDKYLVINELGKVEEVNLANLRTWITKDVIISPNKNSVMEDIEKDLSFFDNGYAKFIKKNSLLNVTGNNYLKTKVIQIDDENALSVVGIDTDVIIPNNTVKIPREVEHVHLRLGGRTDIKVIDLRLMKKARVIHLYISDNKQCTNIIFPNCEIESIEIECTNCSVELSNYENIVFKEFELNNCEIKNTSLDIKMLGGNYNRCRFISVENLRELKVDSQLVMKYDNFSVSSCNDLEYLDISKLKLNGVTQSCVERLKNLKVYKLGVSGGTYYGACYYCTNLERFELYGSIRLGRRQSITSITPSLKEVIINAKLTDFSNSDDCSFETNGFLLSKIINNSNIPTEKLFRKEYLAVCNKYGDDLEFRDFYKCTSLEIIHTNNEIRGFKLLSIHVLSELDDNNNFSRLLKSGIMNIPKDIIHIAHRAISNIRIKQIILNGPVILSDNAFLNNSYLEEVVNSEYIKDMGKYAFAYCTKLTKFRCSNNITKIPCGAFLMCKSLKELEVGNNVKEMEDYALFGCVSLELKGNLKFKFTDTTVLNKEYIFKLKNQDIVSLVLDVSKNNSVALSDVVEFSEIKLLRKLFKHRRYEIRRMEYDNDSNDLEKLSKLMSYIDYYDKKMTNNIKINLSYDLKNSGINKARDNYYYLIIAKQTNSILKKLDAQGLLSNILKGL